MSHRDEALIVSYSDAVEWLERYKDTITDSQVIKVIEQLETEEREDLEEIADQLDSLQDKYDALVTLNKKGLLDDKLLKVATELFKSIKPKS
jgi:acyl carrier protein phosphodiesterase